MTESETKETEEDDMGTEDPDYRWKGLATLLAILIGTSLPVIVILGATGMVEISQIPQAWYIPYTTGWMMVMVYTFGKKTLEAVGFEK